PIKISDLMEYVRLGKEDDCFLLRKEFKEIPDMNGGASSTSGNKTENRYKNRFINILPYDHSRVVLDGVGSDYINANYIDGYKRAKAYIASQGSSFWTVEDMWRMVWQVDALRIVMVTNLIEKGRVKCEQYWSDVENEEKLYGDIVVTLRDVEVTTDYIIRTFELRHKDNDVIRSVKQFHYVAWPDHGVPDRVWPIISFRRKVRQYDDSHPGVVLVHCSAGVGRTGAYIALDYLLDQSANEQAIDVFQFTSNMRKDRVNMIQTLDQYIFVYDALLEALNIKNTIISSSEFPTKFHELKTKLAKLEKPATVSKNKNNKNNKDDDKPDDYKLGDSEENKEKNRYPNILPADNHRPYLMTRVQGTNDYINAVYLDSYRKKNAYLITQMPMTHTVIDMWRLVYEVRCGTLIMLNPWDENDQTYGQYWSEENEECECGPFMIEAMSVNRENEHITVRELKLTFNLSDDEEVSVFNNDVDCDVTGLATFKNTLINMLEYVEKSQIKTGNNPIIIHCRDGVTHSGLYATISCVIERLKDEQEVDIFQSVRRMRDHRPSIIRNYEQYKLCYEMVLNYLSEFSIYSNFR
ncbi:hypothetical protein HELRODRAFT_140014, partial [Helobdella robusta]|uniref:protein-tyrosine-phosphatase n=1 Tax=Helobdella robusta TaxID=6412 RepID=T1EIZ7_HELRO